ncbi:sugar ABC transporter permease [Candidatus Aerophobetes bacterium Ae_b3a]|nr:MAG: sugar ABC transporter permease [Candidatus Aerophobetes bacterium Ae_b3a]
MRKERHWYLFVAPALGLFLLFILYPLVWNFYLSFTKSSLIRTTWVGLFQYVRIASDRTLLNALYNTLYLTFFNLLTQLPLALLIATLLNEIKYARTPFRIIYFLPYVTSIVVAAIIWTYMFDPDEGIFNWFLRLLGFKGLLWLSHPSTSKLSVVIFNLWHWLGYQILIYLAGLQTIPPQLYEAAEMDGANSLQKFSKITIPLLKPTTVFLVITGTIGGMQTFQQIYMFGTAVGNPGRSIQTVVAYIYESGWVLQHFGIGATAAVLLFLIIMAITVVNVKFLIREK